MANQWIRERGQKFFVLIIIRFQKIQKYLLFNFVIVFIGQKFFSEVGEPRYLHEPREEGIEATLKLLKHF